VPFSAHGQRPGSVALPRAQTKAIGRPGQSGPALPRFPSAGSGATPSLQVRASKRIIYLTMGRRPSHLETFELQAKLGEMNGKPRPSSPRATNAQLQGAKLTCFRTAASVPEIRQSNRKSARFSASRHRADDLCIIRSLRPRPSTTIRAHAHEHRTTIQPGRAGLMACGTVSAATVTTCPDSWCLLHWKGWSIAADSRRQWHSGFLPSKSGRLFRSKGDPVLYATVPEVSLPLGTRTSWMPRRIEPPARRGSRRSELPPGSANTRWPFACRRVFRT